VLNPVAAIGRAVLSACQGLGALTLFAAEAVSHLVRPPFYWPALPARLHRDRLVQRCRWWR
jgi:ABC-type transporter Mla maintaining outer membrane lipid asymmetry permease subunit MlaE